MEPGGSYVRACVHHVNPGGDEGRQDQSVALLGGVSEAAAAGVPPGVMQLILDVGHG